MTNNFDLTSFINFLDKSNIFPTVAAAIISERINDFANVFVNDIIMQIIYRDANSDGVHDIAQIETKVIKIHGVEFRIGKLVVSLVKFILVTYVIFIVSRILQKITKIDIT